MIRWARFVLIATALGGAPRAAAQEAAAVFDAASPSVFSVLAQLPEDSMSQGSAVVVGRGLLATNLHVVARAQRVQVLQGGQAFEARVEATDAEHDLALLRAPQVEAPEARFGDSGAVRVGDPVYAIGSPRGLELSLSQGIVSALRPMRGANVIQTTAAISPGSSGGGLFDAHGRLLGLTTAQVIDGQNLNFAMPVELFTGLGLAVTPAGVEAPLPAARAPAAAREPMPAAPLPEPAVEPAAASSAAEPQARSGTARRTIWTASALLLVLLLLAKPATRLLAERMAGAPVEQDDAPSRTVDRLAPFRATARAELAKPEARDAQIWAQAVHQTQGDQTRALAAYVELRANVLYREELDRRWNKAQAQAHGPIAPRK